MPYDTKAKPIFTSEELAELAAYDAMVDAEPIDDSDLAAGVEAERYAKLEGKSKKQLKIADYQRRYYEANKAEIADYQRRYREANKAEIADYQRRYYEANKAEIADYRRRYYEANKAEIADYQRRYREAKKIASKEAL